jgi:hypothetical protein
VILRTRGGSNRAERYPLILWSVPALLVDSIVLDGEVAVLDTAGISGFDALHALRRDGPPKVFIRPIVRASPALDEPSCAANHNGNQDNPNY